MSVRQVSASVGMVLTRKLVSVWKEPLDASGHESEITPARSARNQIAEPAAQPIRAHQGRSATGARAQQRASTGPSRSRRPALEGGGNILIPQLASCLLGPGGTATQSP